MQSQAPSIQQLVNSGAVWRGANSEALSKSSEYPPVSTGLKELDAYLSAGSQLPGGWQWGRMHEVQCPHWFMGEVHLLHAALRLAAAEQAPVFWVAPPAIPYAHTLSRLTGPGAEHIHVRATKSQEALWATESILDAGCARVVCLWANELSQTDSRKLHLAIQGKRTLGFVFTQTLSAEARSFATRIRLPQLHLQEPCKLLKRQGGWPVTLSQWPYLRQLS